MRRRQVAWPLEGKGVERRRSPKRGTVEHLFEELVYLPDLLARRRFELEVLLTEEEEVRRQDGTARAWRHAYSLPSMIRRLWGTACPLAVGLVANIGYRFYSRRLKTFYTCDRPLVGAAGGSVGPV